MTDSIFKIVFVGNSGIGKSSILRRYTECTFDDCTCATVGAAYKDQRISFEGKSIKLHIWDVDVSERHASQWKLYAIKCNGIFVVYDITDRKSFERIRDLISEIDSSAGVCRVLNGNKCDLEERRAIKTEEGELLARKYGIPFFETSAKESVNVEEMFNAIILNMINNGYKVIQD